MMIVNISILAWNNIENTKILISSLLHEVSICKDYIFNINFCDNGSIDGTKDFIENFNNVNLIRLEHNCGISISKNILINKAISQNSKYMFMFDNDVSVIEGSFREMIKFMENNVNVACFGQNIDYYTKDINSKNIPKIFPQLKDSMINYNLKSGCGATRAWTHYSVYRTSIFSEGILFDENGPFGSAGYGFDDDDLGMQIKEKGYDIACFSGICCYHNMNSSVDNLKKENNLNYNKRETYFKNKWGINK